MIRYAEDRFYESMRQALTYILILLTFNTMVVFLFSVKPGHNAMPPPAAQSFGTAMSATCAEQ